jgi:hypothetical protein
MKRLFFAAALVLAVLSTGAAQAQIKGTTAARLRLVRAQCTTGPCAPQFDFRRGDVQLRKVKNPKPVGDRRFGRVSIIGLDAGLNPLPQTVDVQVSGRQTFDNDPDSDCVLANTTVTGIFGTSSANCNVSAFNLGRCRGDLFFTAIPPFVSPFLAPQCSDVRRTIEDISIEIYEGGFAGDPAHLIATTGIMILGKSPDCNSGGSGCP